MNYLDQVRQRKTQQKESQDKQAVLDVFGGVSKEIRTLLDSLEKTGAKKFDKSVIDSIKVLERISKEMKSVKVTSDEDIKHALITLAEVLGSLELRPVINVEAPKVEVNEREIDFKPLISKLTPPEVLEYKAQDLGGSPNDTNIQFVGFVNAKGAWYIIENNMTLDTLRYKFGKENYAEGWEGRTQHKYSLYNEAINEA